MKVKKLILKIYVKNRKLPFCEVELDNENSVEEFYRELNSSNEFVRFGQLILKKSEFTYALFIYK